MSANTEQTGVHEQKPAECTYTPKIGLSYQQAKRAVELFEDEWIGQDAGDLWHWALEEVLESTKTETSADLAGQNDRLVMRNPGGIREAVKSLSNYWVTYPEQEDYGHYSLDTLLDDCLYGIGIAIGPDDYKYANGYDKFKRDLKAWLERA